MSETTETLFKQVLNVMNQSIAVHQDTFLYREIFKASEKIHGGKHIGVAVYADDQDTPHDYYTICFENGKFELISHGKEEPALTWKVSESYLRKVADNPQEFIRHPEKLDWEWLKSRIGSLKPE